MKIIIVGASGRIGKEVDKAMSGNYDISRAGNRIGDVQYDYTSADSVRNMFEKFGVFDALITFFGGDSVFQVFIY